MSLWTQSSTQEAFDERLGQAWGDRRYSSNQWIVLLWWPDLRRSKSKMGHTSVFLLICSDWFKMHFRKNLGPFSDMSSNSITVMWSSHWWIVASAVISTYYDLSFNTKCQPHGGTRGKHWPTWIPSSHLANVAKGVQNATSQQLTLSECLHPNGQPHFTTLKWDVGQFKDSNDSVRNSDVLYWD